MFHMNNRSNSIVLHVVFLVLQRVTVRLQSPTQLVPPLLSTCSASQEAYHLMVQNVEKAMNQLLPVLSFLLELYHWLVLVYQALLLPCSRITSQAVTKPHLPTPSNQCSLVHVELLLTVLSVVCHICPLPKLCSLLCSVQLFPFTFCVRKNMLYIVDARAQLFYRKQFNSCRK